MLLYYNDGDLVEEAVRCLVDQSHDVMAWDHGSTDETPDVLRSLRSDLVELQTLPRSVDFYDLYRKMSEHLLSEYVSRYDWISWPDQDEFLEGPDRARSYRRWVEEVAASSYDWVEFNNFNYWWTSEDDPPSPARLAVSGDAASSAVAPPGSARGGPLLPTSGSSPTTRLWGSGTRAFSTSATTR